MRSSKPGFFTGFAVSSGGVGVRAMAAVYARRARPRSAPRFHRRRGFAKLRAMTTAITNVRGAARARVTAAALAAAALLSIAGASACGGKPVRSGKELFQLQGCVLCHGKEGEGTALGPVLHGASAHWTKATLVEYLRDPHAWQQKD